MPPDFESEPPFITEAQAVSLYMEQMRLYGGTPGIRDEGAFLSALSAPKWAYNYGQTDLFTLAAYYFDHLSNNHAFTDGNKRMGTAGALTFLKLCGIELQIPDEELIQLALDVAQGLLTNEQVANALRSHAQSSQEQTGA